MRLNYTAFAAAAFIWAGCSKNPAENVPAADVRAATNATAAATAPASGQPYAIDAKNSTISFVGSKVTGKHDGGFKNFAGQITVVNGAVAPTGNKVVIDTTSIWSDSDRLTGHLKNQDFFNVPKYPTSTFETTGIEKTATNYLVTGNLTLHGVTKQIAFPANIEVKPDAVTLTSEFFLNRFDFEMKYPGKADDLIRQEVVLKLNIKAVPGQASLEAVEKPNAS